MGASLIEYGSISFSKMEHGAAACGLEDELSRIWKKYQSIGIDGVGFEHAFNQLGQAHEPYMALQTALKMWAHRRGIPHYRVATTTLKKAVTGYGRAEKPDIIEAVVRQYGIDLDPQREHPDSDIADAIGVAIALRN